MDLNPLTADDHALIDLARRTVDENTDGPDGIYTMGAAVRGADGHMFAGINLYHFTGGPCAELVALGHARASGARDLVSIVAVGNENRGVQAPAAETAKYCWTTTQKSESSSRAPTARAGPPSPTYSPEATAGSPEVFPAGTHGPII
ncbi:hypothetical protein [Kribbella antibiotica]|uniref:hypothetical protein n=1 Tax=Kribbella antibiotica TaxID=190195 RepID=UPI00192E0DFF|nr:hypothetical protein [Kribbella antibiotica]